MQSSLTFILTAIFLINELYQDIFHVGAATLDQLGIYEYRRPGNQAGQLYCSYYQSTLVNDMENPTSIQLDVTHTGSQTKCVTFYELQLTSSEDNKYINIDVTITPPAGAAQPLLAYKVGTPPKMTYLANNNIDYDDAQFDLNAFYLLPALNYHHLRISPSDRQTAAAGNSTAEHLIYIALYNFDSPPYVQTIGVSLTASATTSPTCPQNCNSQGSCDATTGKCTCNPGYMNDNCGITYTTISSPVPTPMYIQYYRLYYLAIVVPANGSDYVFKVNNAFYGLYLYTRINTNGIIYPPNYFQYNREYITNNGDYTISFNVTAADLASSGGIIPIALVNLNVFSTYIQISVRESSVASGYNDDDDSGKGPGIPKGFNGSPTAIIAYVFGIVILVFVIMCIVKIFVRKRQHNRVNAQREVRIEELQVHQERLNRLETQDLDRFMPTQSFNSLSHKYEQIHCTICLEDFVPDSDCRMISLCNHIFHGPCLKAWLKRDQTCPNCKMAITKTELEKHEQENQKIKPLVAISLNVESMNKKEAN